MAQGIPTNDSVSTTSRFDPQRNRSKDGSIVDIFDVKTAMMIRSAEQDLIARFVVLVIQVTLAWLRCWCCHCCGHLARVG